jgi:very-short-patch-repair endonuclease
VHPLVRLTNSLDGIATTRELTAAGATSHLLTVLTRSGQLERVRNGWYATPSAAPEAVRAIRVGGRLAGVSAAASYGLATPEEYPLQVHVPHTGSRQRSQWDRYTRLADSPHDGTVVFRDHVTAPDAGTRLRVSLMDCLRQVVMHEADYDAVACLDSAVHQKMLDLIGLEELRSMLPEARGHIVDMVDGLSDSYLESVARVKLIRAGIAVRIQVGVLAERWIDILIGDCLALELDGAGKYRTGGATKDKDSRRDAFLEALGFHVIRISYSMVLYDWDATLAMILAVMDRGDHLARR